ncbi:MAG: hypothetical protein GWP05_00695 [Anaerolineaceae bacterium]|nr:hypothetical protein [Anaerolineaceae bacterium]
MRLPLLIALIVSCLLSTASGLAAEEDTRRVEQQEAASARAIAFRRRTGTRLLIKDRRSAVEDDLRAKALACVQDDARFEKLRLAFNQRWTSDTIEYLGQLIMEDWDKTRAVTLQRSKAIVSLLVHVAAHELPRGFIASDVSMVTINEQKRVLEVRRACRITLDKYFAAVLNGDSKWPLKSRRSLQYHLTYAFDEFGEPEMITETIWVGMRDNDKFRSDMLGIVSDLADEKLLQRLSAFRDSQEWSEADRLRIETVGRAPCCRRCSPLPITARPWPTA